MSKGPKVSFPSLLLSIYSFMLSYLLSVHLPKDVSGWPKLKILGWKKPTKQEF